MTIRHHTANPKFITASKNMHRVLEIVDYYARCEEPVLVTGETGTGKELLSKRLHTRSQRFRKPFVAVNCAAIPRELFERELFGHTQGAYTGAVSKGTGFVEQAEGGTLFLDEIGELSLSLQPKLLRLLEDQTYYRIGDPRMRQANIRIVTATNADLEKMVKLRKFRADLLYRLIGLEIIIPPLRKRREDIIPLIQYFLSNLAGEEIEISDYLNQHEVECAYRNDWPGNTRELLALARKLYMRKGLASIDPEIGAILSAKGAKGNAIIRPAYPELIGMLERMNGNKARLAKSLGVARSTLYRWLQFPEPLKN